MAGSLFCWLAGRLAGWLDARARLLSVCDVRAFAVRAPPPIYRPVLPRKLTHSYFPPTLPRAQLAQSVLPNSAVSGGEGRGLPLTGLSGLSCPVMAMVTTSHGNVLSGQAPARRRSAPLPRLRVRPGRAPRVSRATPAAGPSQRRSAARLRRGGALPGFGHAEGRQVGRMSAAEPATAPGRPDPIHALWRCAFAAARRRGALIYMIHASCQRIWRRADGLAAPSDALGPGLGLTRIVVRAARLERLDPPGRSRRRVPLASLASRGRDQGRGARRTARRRRPFRVSNETGIGARQKSAFGVADRFTS